MNNPEKLATLGTQDTDEDKKEKENHTTQKTKKDDPTKNRGWTVPQSNWKIVETGKKLYFT